MFRGSLFELIAVVALGLLLTLPAIWQKPFLTRGEPREAITAQEILRSGNWILPEAYGGDVPSKPLGLHWLVTLFSLPQGEVTEWTARLPSALASVAFLGTLYLFLAARTERRVALTAVVMLATCVEWWRSAITCRVDMLFSALFAGGLLSLFKVCEGRGSRAAAAILIGAAALVKGPVSIVLPGAIFSVFSLMERRSLRAIVEDCLFVFVPAAVIAVSWYGLAYAERPSEFAAKVYYENVARFLSLTQDEPHKHSAVYLIATLAVGMIPWVFILPWHKLRLKPQALPAWWAARGRFERYALTVVVLIFAFFAVPESKRSVYLLPAYPFLLFLAARWLLAAAAAEQVSKVTALVMQRAGVLLIAVLTGGVLLRAWLPDEVFLSEVASRITGAEIALLAVAAAGLALSARAARWSSRSLVQSVSNMLLVVVSVYLAVGGGLLPAVGRALTEKDMAYAALAVVPQAAQLVTVEDEFYGMSFYMKRAITRAGEQLSPGQYALAFRSDEQDVRGKVPAGARLTEVLSSDHPIIKPEEFLVLWKVEG